MIKIHAFQQKQLSKNVKLIEELDKREKQRKKHLEYVNTRVPCDICNIQSSRANIAKHCKTKKHMKNIEIENKAANDREVKENSWKLNKIKMLNDLKTKVRGNIKDLYKWPVQQQFIKSLDAEIAELMG